MYTICLADPRVPDRCSRRILITDHPWGDATVEAELCRAAGYELVDGGLGDDPAKLVALGADVAGILTCWAPVTSELIGASPALGAITRMGVGLDNIDVEAAESRGVTVTRVPDYCVDEVSDHVVALLFAWARGITWFDRSVRAGRWEPGGLPLRRVRGLRVGIWGSGSSGLATAAKVAALGCEVAVDDRHPDTGYRTFAVPELLARSDVVTIHLPLNPTTEGVVGADAISSMREGSLLVNTSRGRIVDVDALVAGLARGRPAFAALDVLPDEPQVPAALAHRDDVLITPHVAFSSVQSVDELRRRATASILDVLRAQSGAGEVPGS